MAAGEERGQPDGGDALQAAEVQGGRPAKAINDGKLETLREFLFPNMPAKETVTLSLSAPRL
jgi:hypothetical protein